MLILKGKGLRSDFKDDSDGGRETIPGFSGGVSEMLPMLLSVECWCAKDASV